MAQTCKRRPGGGAAKINSKRIFAEHTPETTPSPADRKAPAHLAGGLATAAAKDGWPASTLSERDFVVAGLRQLGDPDHHRALAVRLQPMDWLASIVREAAA